MKKDLSVHDTHLGQFDTASWQRIDLEHPTIESINIEDIATALSNICRFGGHIKEFYSVAQHSVLVTLLAIQDNADKETIKAAFLHDSPETYLGDVIKPLKIKLGDAYREYELEFEDVIFRKFNIDQSKLELVKKYDKQALEIENNALRKNFMIHYWANIWETKYTFSDLWSPKKARHLFLDFYNHLFNEIIA